MRAHELDVKLWVVQENQLHWSSLITLINESIQEDFCWNNVIITWSVGVVLTISIMFWDWRRRVWQCYQGLVMIISDVTLVWSVVTMSQVSWAPGQVTPCHRWTMQSNDGRFYLDSDSTIQLRVSSQIWLADAGVTGPYSCFLLVENVSCLSGHELANVKASMSPSKLDQA